MCSARWCPRPWFRMRWCRRVQSPRVDDAVARVQLWKGRHVEVSPLSGGLTNENYLVDLEGERYVMRVPGQSTELLSIDRDNEVYNTKAAAETGVGPRVLEHVPGLDVMVLEFLPGATMSAETLQSVHMARRMAESFKRLHSARRFKQDFNMFRLIENYLRIVEEHGVAIPPGYPGKRATGSEIERAGSGHALPAGALPHDLPFGKFIAHGAG